MFHPPQPPPLDRRDMLHRLGAGSASWDSRASWLRSAFWGPGTRERRLSATGSPLAPKAPHFAPRAKHVIQLFMPGGPSQVDTFDYKPEIRKYQGQRPAIVDRKSLRNTKNGLFPSPFGFKRYGECGKGSATSSPAWASASTTSASSTPCTRTSRSTPAPS